MQLRLEFLTCNAQLASRLLAETSVCCQWPAVSSTPADFGRGHAHCGAGEGTIALNLYPNIGGRFHYFRGGCRHSIDIILGLNKIVFIHRHRKFNK